MQPTAVVYSYLKNVITGYIKQYSDSFFKKHSLFGMAGVPRAREMLAELNVANAKLNVTANDLIQVVGQDKYNTGRELISRVAATVLYVADVKPERVQVTTKKIVDRLNKAPIVPNRSMYVMSKYTVYDERVRELARHQIFNEIVQEMKTTVPDIKQENATSALK